MGTKEEKGRGIFVVLEGIDGSGKTSLLRELEAMGYVTTREPWSFRATRDTTLEEFLGDRDLHVKWLREALGSEHSGDTVVSDRYAWSTLTHQGTLDNRGLVPDLYILLDIPTLLAYSRLVERGAGMETLEYLENLRERYLGTIESVRGSGSKVIHLHIGKTETPKTLARLVDVLIEEFEENFYGRPSTP